MATTTNYGWETPDDTDLVKDGAAAIRTLGSAIDTSLVDLKGGTTGQVLSKASNTDMDFTWGTSGGLTLISTATPSAATTVSFTSIPTTYKMLIVKYVARQSVNNTYFSVQLNAQASGHNWVATAIQGNNLCLLSAVAANESGFAINSRFSVVPICATTDTADQCQGVFQIYDADLSQTRHQVTWKASGRGSLTQHNEGNGYIDLTSAGAITQIDFIRNSTQTITGTFYLYGAF